MKLKVISYNQEEAKDLLKTRLAKCQAYRKAKFEDRWKENETRLFSVNSGSGNNTITYNSLENTHQLLSDSGNVDSISIPKVAQNLRFLHSQMSANPVSVIPTPTSNELKDRRTTEAVGDLITYGRKQYDMQEYVDLVSLSTLTYGSGIVKSYHDHFAGEVLKYDEGSGEIEMTGDYKVRPVLIWDLWFDNDPNVWADVKFTFERVNMPYGVSKGIWPDQADAIMAAMADKNKHPSEISGYVPNEGDNIDDESVAVYLYTERKLPENGMAGRECYHLEDGTILGEMKPNGHPNACLPYHLLTDIDDPNEIYGLTVVDYAIGLAKVVDSLDNMVLNNVELHGSIKLVVFGNSDTNDEDYSDDPVDIIHVDGTHAHAPYQLKPASVSSDVYNLRGQMLESIDGIMGVNELLQGKISRELSGFASQTAINAANMVRHRLFNKYTRLVEFVFKNYVENVKKFWKVKRKLEVIGSEDAITVRYLEGADISSGFSLQVDYGSSFSLNPESRREEIMQSKELLVEAGISPKKIAKMMRYNEIDNLFDAVELSAKRQIEIFEEAINHYEKSGKVKIEDASDMRKAFHMEMAEAAMEFVMTRDFLGLDKELKEAIYDHIDDREKLAAESAAPPPGEMPAAQGGPPILGQPPMGVPPPSAMPDIGDVLP